MSTGSIEEKIIQRQLSKEGLQNIVEDTDQVNEISTAVLKDLFVLHQDTPSDTHDTLRCKRCSTVKTKSDIVSKAASLSNNQARACIEFVGQFLSHLQSEAKTIGREFPPDDFNSIIRNLRYV
jgi:hypothetical protein|tara:strand:- start:216 stop:584 length:369 start_codon:yes stop_codon:yes gene_type:complete